MKLRKDLTLANRIALLDLIDSQPPNTSHRQLARITGVPKSTIARALKRQDKLREEWALVEGMEGGASTGATAQKRKRLGKDPEVEEALSRWFSIAMGRGVYVNGPMLKAKSEELARTLGREDFRATDGWLTRWKARNDVDLRKMHHGDDAGDDDVDYYDDDDDDVRQTAGAQLLSRKNANVCFEIRATESVKKVSTPTLDNFSRLTPTPAKLNFMVCAIKKEKKHIKK